eukprot:jgi/Chrzof1/6920/Cz02g03130.t1
MTRLRAHDDREKEFQDAGGDKTLQNALMEQLRLEIQNQTLKEEIKDDLRGKIDRMRRLSEELQEKLGEDIQIEKFRMDLESSQTLSDAMDKFDQLEDELQQIKDKIKADEAELNSWEQQSNVARSKGLFFKSLYESDASQPVGDGSSLSSAEALHKAAAAVRQSAEGEVYSPLRLYLYTYMAIVLALVVIQDLTNPTPKLFLDGLYGVLGTLLGINAWQERKTLAEKQVHADHTGSSTPTSSSSSCSREGEELPSRTVQGDGSSSSSKDDSNQLQ